MDSIVPPDDAPLKQCTKCQEWKLATLEHFHKGDGTYGLKQSCKSCRSRRKTPLPEPAPQGYKRCGSCQNIYPATTEFFHSARNRPDHLYPQCKTCANAISRKGKPKTPPAPKEVLPEGYKRCTKCKEILPATKEFFSATPAYVSKDLLSKQCKKCRKEYRQEHSKDVQRVAVPKKPTKRCPDCKRELKATFDNFCFHRHTADHLNRICKDCANKKSKNYRARLGGKEIRQSYRRSRKHITDEYSRNYHRTHREHEREYRRQYRKEHREQIRLHRWQRDQTEHGRLQRRTHTLNRLARKKSIPGVYTPAQIAEQLKRQRYRCYYAACGFSKFEKVNGKYVYVQMTVKGPRMRASYEVDHTYSLKQAEGTNIPANDMNYLVLACPSCNNSKGSRLPHEWFEGGRLL